ncbi:hypothetical protein O1L68_21480 [Streptomyces lydicus]|nr:hypothetical protein [Streptomyces lydicus]
MVRAARRTDPLGALLAVQLLGLLTSPISWCHHWVWAVAAVLWLTHAPHRTRAHTAALTAWCLALAGFLIHWLALAQPDIWRFGRPWYLAALGWGYPACAVLTLVALLLPVTGRRRTGPGTPAAHTPSSRPGRPRRRRPGPGRPRWGIPGPGPSGRRLGSRTARLAALRPARWGGRRSR